MHRSSRQLVSVELHESVPVPAEDWEEWVGAPQ